MKLWTLITSLTAFLLILSGCGAEPKPAKKITIDATLPIVTLTRSGTFIDMNAVAFEWKSIEDERVKGIYIYKQDMSKVGDKKVDKIAHYKTIANRFTTHYVDTNILPDTSYTYSFKTYSQDAESQMSPSKVLNSLPVLKSVSWIKSIQNMPRSAKIIWRPHTNLKVKSYVVERRTLKDNEWKKIATVNDRLNAEYIDTKLKDNFVYKYRVRVVTFDGIVSTPSDIVNVVTKALPKSIVNIKTTTNLPKKIEIKWAKSNTEDFDRYYLYKSEDSDGSYDLIAKLHNNKFVDKVKEDGKEYFYRVSAVEKNGLESIHDKLSVQGVTLTKPNFPNLRDVRLVNGRVEIAWDNRDSRAKTFTVLKKIKTGWFDATQEEFTDIKSERFIDAEVGPNITYFYRVYAVDKFGIKSEASIEIELKTPKTLIDRSVKPIVKQKTVKKERATTRRNPNIKVEEVKITPTQDFN